MSFNKPFLAGLALCAVFIAPSYAQGVKDMRDVTPAELIQPPTAEEEGSAADMADVSVSPATHISLDTLGLYDEDSGGLPFSIWNKSSHERVKTLLAQQPERQPSPAMRRLMTRMLLSTTQPPKSGNIRQQVFRPRVETLLKLDELDQAQRLLELVPQDLRTAETARLEYTTHLLKGDTAWVCEHIGDALAKYAGDSPQWAKYSIFCLAREKDVAKTQLALDVQAEQQVELDAGFTALVDVMLGRAKEPANRFTHPMALDDAAMVALSGHAAFPEGYVENEAPLPVLRLIHRNESFPEAVREQAQKALATASALEQTGKTRATMQRWFADVLKDNAPGDGFNFDRAAKTMQEKGGAGDAVTEAQRRYRFFSLLRALGYARLETQPDWDALSVELPAQRHVSPQLRYSISQAVDDALNGEAILLMAAALGQGDTLAEIDDATLVDIVRGLETMGYHEAADRLAVDAMAALY